MDLKVLPIILTVTGIVALIVSLTRGPNLGISPKAGNSIGIALVALGIALFLVTRA